MNSVQQVLFLMLSDTPAVSQSVSVTSQLDLSMSAPWCLCALCATERPEGQTLSFICKIHVRASRVNKWECEYFVSLIILSDGSNNFHLTVLKLPSVSWHQDDFNVTEASSSTLTHTSSLSSCWITQTLPHLVIWSILLLTDSFLSPGVDLLPYTLGQCWDNHVCCLSSGQNNGLSGVLLPHDADSVRSCSQNNRLRCVFSVSAVFLNAVYVSSQWRRCFLHVFACVFLGCTVLSSQGHRRLLMS